MIKRSTVGRFSPPYSSGHVSAIHPLAETFFVKPSANSQKSSSSQNSVERSHSGGSSSARNDRTSSRHSICSLVNVSSMSDFLKSRGSLPLRWPASAVERRYSDGVGHESPRHRS